MQTRNTDARHREDESGGVMESVGSIGEHLRELVEERERMRRVLSDYKTGRLPIREVPTDAHTYYGRIEQADAAIERYAAEEAARILRLDQQTSERRERLEHLLETERGHIKDTTDLPDPLSWRLAAETVAWREGISKREPRMIEREREIWRDTLGQRAQEINAGWHAAEVVTAVEASAALNYWRGRAEEFNTTREAIVRHRPELAKDLPPALEVDEIQVRQRVLERERGKEKSLAVTP